MPSSTACRKIGSAASSSNDHWSAPRAARPKLMHPSVIRLILRPELPRRVYSMIPTYRPALFAAVDGERAVLAAEVVPGLRAVDQHQVDVVEPHVVREPSIAAA